MYWIVPFIVKLFVGSFKKPYYLIAYVYLAFCVTTLISKYVTFRIEASEKINLAAVYYTGCQESKNLVGFPACNTAKMDSSKWRDAEALQKLIIEFPNIMMNELNIIVFVTGNYAILVTAIYSLITYALGFSGNIFESVITKYKAKRIARDMIEHEEQEHIRKLGGGIPISYPDNRCGHTQNSKRKKVKNDIVFQDYDTNLGNYGTFNSRVDCNNPYE